MSDQVENSIPSVDPSELEQFFTLKQKQIQHLSTQYNSFIASMNGIPAMRDLLKIAMDHFFTGFVIMEKAIAHVPFTQVPVPAPMEQIVTPLENVVENTELDVA